VFYLLINKKSAVAREREREREKEL